MSEAERIARELREHPPGWQADHDRPDLRGSCNAGGDSHTYDGSCAICRAGDRPEALVALVAEVLRLATGHETAAQDTPPVPCVPDLDMIEHGWSFMGAPCAEPWTHRLWRRWKERRANDR